MREYIEYQISALNDLIRINKDRITGYRQRIATTTDDDLEELFSDLIYQSYQHIEELTYNIYQLGGNPARPDPMAGKFYHSWTDLKALIFKETRKKMLDYCEFCEDVVKAIYQKAFNAHELHWDKRLSTLLKKHMHEVENSYNYVLILKGGFA
ncbi:MAG TPA: PA2169 family four-helix-bundle protein [Mucilaginibacter sp.]|nr:PA2169 family four-helix-bundle protein [Mucilaginibacter sp.]